MTAKELQNLLAWLVGILIAVAPVLLVLPSEKLDDWIPAYVAGGLGGLVMELLLARWSLEMPSFVPAPPQPEVPADDDEEDGDEDDEAIFANPLGDRLDLGFFGRFFTAALAGVAFLVLSAVVIGDRSLTSLEREAGSVSTVIWALVLGVSSPAVWRAMRKIVEARVASVRRGYVKKLARRDAKLESAKIANKKALQKAREAKRQRQRRRQRRGTTSGGSRGQLLVTGPSMRKVLATALMENPPARSEVDSRVEAFLSDESQMMLLDDEDDGEDEDLDQAIGTLEALQEQLNSGQ